MQQCYFIGKFDFIVHKLSTQAYEISNNNIYNDCDDQTLVFQWETGKIGIAGHNVFSTYSGSGGLAAKTPTVGTFNVELRITPAGNGDLL